MLAAMRRLATPIGDPVYVPETRRQEPAALITIAITIIALQEELLWLIN